jgi:hypothetical protein
MKIATTTVHCGSAQCMATGNAERVFVVCYEQGTTQMHSLHCPYCHGEIEVELGGGKVRYVAPDSLLAS